MGGYKPAPIDPHHPHRLGGSTGAAAGAAVAGHVAGADPHTGYIAHADISPDEGFVRKTGAGTYTAIKSNMAASAAPTVNDDTGDGYGIGSRWLDTTNDREYVCLDATLGAAVWAETTGSGSGAPTTADYLVGTADGTLSNEIVVGTAPGGELGGTWASPTVDATHAGSNHNQPVRKNSAGTVFERRRLNFIEGSNVTLTVADDAGNDEVDITIAATGGGGAPTDAEYVTTAANGTLSAEKVIDKGAYQLLTRRAAANTEDDHFDAGTLDAKWLAYTNHDASTDLTALAGWCKTTVAGSKLQAMPAGDWTIEVEVLHRDITAAIYTNAGLVLTDGTNYNTTNAYVFSHGHNNSLTDLRFQIDRFVNGAYSSSPLSLTGQHPGINHIFLRVVKSGTTYAFEWSSTGKTFARLWSGTLAVTPTHIGIEGDAGSYFNYFLRY